MKEKIKNIIQYISIGYMIIIILLTITNMFGMNKTLDLTDSTENIEKIKELKNEIANLEDNSCKVLLNDMIKAYETTSFDGIIEQKRVEKIYWEGKSFLSFYERMTTDCNISKEELKRIDMPFYALNSTSFIDNTVNKKIFDYELRIKDIYMRDNLEANRVNLDYQLSKQSEIVMIEKILKTIGGNTNE